MLEKLRWLINKLMFFPYVCNIKSIEALAGNKPSFFVYQMRLILMKNKSFAVFTVIENIIERNRRQK
ncbi:MAG: hypothetical protein NUV40_03965 [Patescibacteria group bacterium]|nr:hypothetical protein [Patescibacteria group bacterium]